jgi:1-acyl-sn-glycerol-3-phosphate acyltransferase
MLYWIVIRSARFLAKVFYRLKIYGREHILPGSAILASNHASFLDPPILSVSCPEDVYFLARKTLFRGLFGKFIYALNARPVSAGSANLEVFRQIAALLGEGKKVILFPEGTRSTDGKLGEFKPGIFLLFHRTGCAVQPAYIAGTDTIWGRTRKLPKLFGKTACVFGTAILWDSYETMPKREAEAQFSKDLRKSIEELKTWYESGAKGTPP